ncbi:MAG: hypothetical protein U1F43_13620 [Myxococcota bacterium]
MQRRGLLSGLAVALGVGACTDAGFQPIAPPALATVDPLLEIRGRFCTEPPEDIVFPVKVFLTDQSASLQCTDPENRRYAAVDDIISQLRSNPYVSFGAIGSSWSRELPFTLDRGALDAVLDGRRRDGHRLPGRAGDRGPPARERHARDRSPASARAQVRPRLRVRQRGRAALQRRL